MQKVFLLNLNEYMRNLPISGGYQMSYSDIGMHRIKPVYMNTDVRTPSPPPPCKYFVRPHRLEEL